MKSKPTLEHLEVDLLDLIGELEIVFIRDPSKNWKNAREMLI